MRSSILLEAGWFFMIKHTLLRCGLLHIVWQNGFPHLQYFWASILWIVGHLWHLEATVLKSKGRTNSVTSVHFRCIRKSSSCTENDSSITHQRLQCEWPGSESSFASGLFTVRWSYIQIILQCTSVLLGYSGTLHVCFVYSVFANYFANVSPWCLPL